MSVAGYDNINLTVDQIIEDTWTRLGRRMSPLKGKIAIRTQIPRKVTKGGIILTDRESSFYHGLPNIGLPGKETAMRLGYVLAVGEDVADIRQGDIVFFPRGHFIRLEEMGDGSFFGMVEADNIWAVTEYENENEGSAETK